MESRITPVGVEMPWFGLTALTSRHTARFQMPVVRHPYHKLCFVEAGRGALLTDAETIDLRPGSLVRLDPNRRHRFTDDPQDPLTLSILCVDGVGSRRLNPHGLWGRLIGDWPVGTMASADSFDTELRLHFRGLIRELGRQRPGYESAVLGLALQVLAWFSRAVEAPDDRAIFEDGPTGHAEVVRRAVAYIDHHLTEPLTIAGLADHFDLSYRSFTQHFRRLTGCTFTQYLHRGRVEIAKRRLLATGDILGAAHDAGYGELSYFYRVFRRHAGLTPGQFLARGRDDG